METQKRENENRIIRKDIYCGILSHLKVVHVDDKINGAEILDRAITKKVIALNVRKIAFAKKDICVGQDLFYSLNRVSLYEYGIILPSYRLDCDVAFNNTLVIRNPQSLGAILGYAGFDSELSKSDLAKIKEILMSRNDILSIEAHDVKLGINGIETISSENVSLINEQASALRDFRRIALPERPQKIEKVYAKYFK